MVQQGKKTRLKIQDDRYYCIDLKNPLKPKLIKDSFYDLDEAKYWFDRFLKKNSRYFLIPGNDLKKYRGQYTLIKPPYATKAIKHDRRKMIQYTVIDIKQKRKVNRRKAFEDAIKERGIEVSYDYPDTPEGLSRREQKTYRERMRRKTRRKQIYKQIKPLLP